MKHFLLLLYQVEGITWLSFVFFVNWQKLLQRGQERDQFLAEMKQKEEPDHSLELRQTIQILQERLKEREGVALRILKPLIGYLYVGLYVGPTCNPLSLYTKAELSRRNSDDNAENIPHSKKTIVILKKELVQKTEALNIALKRENELKVC